MPPCARYSDLLERGSMCAAISIGACSTTSSGHSDTAQHSAWSPSIGRPSPVVSGPVPAGSARSLAPGVFQTRALVHDDGDASIDVAFGPDRRSGDGRGREPDADLP